VLLHLRNVAIVAVAALGITVLPGGGDAADAALTALSMAFLAAIALFVYRVYREQQLTISTLSEGRRAILLGALGLIAFLIAGADELFETGGGALAWIALMALSVAAIVLVWREATTYS
jgi:hypothetical protein